MDIVLLVVLGLAMGMVFGIALEKSRVFEPGMIVGQMQLRNFIMLKMFMSAMATGLVALAVLNGMGLVELHPKATHVLANLAGGLIMGAGMALAGACPGTVMAQIGAGYKDAWAVLIGGLAAAGVFGYASEALDPVMSVGQLGKVRLDELVSLPFPVAAIIMAALLVGALYALERWRPWREETGSDFDGTGLNVTPTTPSTSAQPAE